MTEDGREAVMGVGVRYGGISSQLCIHIHVYPSMYIYCGVHYAMYNRRTVPHARLEVCMADKRKLEASKRLPNDQTAQPVRAVQTTMDHNGPQGAPVFAASFMSVQGRDCHGRSQVTFHERER